MPERWRPFETAAARYEAWYETPRGRRADQAERALLEELIAEFPGAGTLLEVGCGTGHFAGGLDRRGLTVVGLDRAPAMLAELRRRHPRLPVVLGDAHALPFRDAAVDLTLFVTTLEFLEDPAMALREAVRVSRRGVVLLALNRWSLGGLSRRVGPAARGTLLGQARDVSILSLRALIGTAAGPRLSGFRRASTLWPDGLWAYRASVPLGDVIGIAARLTATPGMSV
jgi:SAM-dependent methyltransferase